VLFILLLLCAAARAAASPVEFVGHVLAADMAGGSQVVIADLNKDGRPDIVAVAGGKSELIWFENPTWKRHVILEDTPKISNAAPVDLDTDGIPELVVAHGFAPEVEHSAGVISVVTHRGDPRKPWKAVEIDRVPTSHRLLWANLDGAKALVSAPLTGLKGIAPLIVYRPGAWMREAFPQETGIVVQGIRTVDWDGDGRDDLLRASTAGIHLMGYAKGGQWTSIELAKGNSADASYGRLGNGTRFVASLEPWPGRTLAVYRKDEKGAWLRQAIDDSLAEGDNILTSDLNGDGVDEIVSGFRGAGRGVNIYYTAGAKSGKWIKIPLDSGTAVSHCAAGDLNGDGRPDVACIGPPVLKWYENRGVKKD
jgi:hypothetical protein